MFIKLNLVTPWRGSIVILGGGFGSTFLHILAIGWEMMLGEEARGSKERA
jgi:hypothetical protein